MSLLFGLVCKESVDMIQAIRQILLDRRTLIWAVVAAVLIGAALLGLRPSIYWLVLLAAVAGFVILLQHLTLGLAALIFAAIAVPLQFSTGTAVDVNVATLLVPTLLALWVMEMMRRQEMHLVPSSTTKPLFIFLGSGLLSLVIGNALWDPMVPRSGAFIIVQFAQ